MHEKLTILTCTYNRSKALVQWVYTSLIKQSNLNFVWLIIDDGSTDDTRKIVQKMKRTAPFLINYRYKSNGGKHTAMDFSHTNIDSEFVLILDSDEALIPDAVDIIYRDWEKWDSDITVGALVYRKGITVDNPTGKAFPVEGYRSNQIDAVTNARNGGEHFTVFRSEVFKSYEFPKFVGETFISEAHLWHMCSCDYDFIFYNTVLGTFEYLENGLTRGGRRLRLTNWQGASYTALLQMDVRYIFRVRIKGALAYVGYQTFGGKKIRDILKSNPNTEDLVKLALIPGLIIGGYWKMKYRHLKK